MTTDNARSILADPRAPADERYDATAELQKAHRPTSSDLIPAGDMSQLIDFMKESYEDQAMEKAMSRPNIIPFPSKAVRDNQPGMQSVYLDDQQVGMMGEYYERPSAFGFDSMRMMVDQTPILSSIILTRIRQVQAFCRPQENGKGPGFEIRLRDKEQTVGSGEKQSMKLLQGFFSNCGWETNPRQRERLKRDDFSSFMTKLTRDSLTLDSAPIETEFKKDKRRGMDGFYAVDGATIRLCTEAGYQGDDEIKALQVVQGQFRTAYTFDDLIYKPRNPRTDVLVGGYGQSETELLIKTVTYLLNAMTYNGKFFDSNSIPKGLLHLSGNFDNKDLSAFKRQWNGMVKGINNAWSMPVLVSKDQESKSSFENFGVDIDEMAFSKWMVFLTSIACAIYGIAPDEINFESFSAKAGGLAGNDTDEKLSSSHDKGLVPLLRYFENLHSDFIVADFSEKYVFRFTGLDEEDEKQRFERNKLILTVNEMRAQDSLPNITQQWGDAPLNPSLVGAWQAEAQAPQEDFGQPGADGEGAPADDGGDKPDFGDAGEDGDGEEQDFGGKPALAAPGAPPEDMGKSFGLPVFVVEA